ncbi:MAG TPA: hypothetical protein VLZ83_13045 [Edaphocola sp.]|nr:hypothetical protein [Edaphocola sp.]
MKNKLIYSISFLLMSLFSINKCYAQADIIPVLPDFNIETKDGINILTFYNTYEYGIKVITVSRSNDSSVNFTTIGTIPQTKRGNAVFIDAHPLLGKNWYQIKMEFTSGVDFSSNLNHVTLDSADLKQQKAIINTEQLQEDANKAMENSKSVIAVVESQVKNSNFVQSKYVFTNTFTGHVNIELKDAYTTNYRVEFYNQNKKKVLTIPRVKEPVVILDKRNFNNLGLYSFKLYKNDKLMEDGFVSIY